MLKNNTKRGMKREMKAKVNKVYPKNVDGYWTVPDLIADDGKVRSFSYYLVHSETGDIWSLKSGRNLCPSQDDNGYLRTGMVDDDGQTYNCSQHRIVLAAKLQHWNFIEANHINHLPWDNRPSNLEPTDSKGNKDEICRANMSAAKTGSKHPNAKLDEDDVYLIKVNAMYTEDIVGYKREMADTYGVHPNNIHMILSGKTWNHVEV